MNTLDRDTLVADIIKIYIGEIGFFTDEEKASINEHTQFSTDFKIIDDDITAFIYVVEYHFSIKTPDDAWFTVATIGDIADLVIKYNGYVTIPYVAPADFGSPEWMNKIGQFFKWLCKKRW